MVGACYQHCSYVAWAPLWLAEASVHQIRLLPSCRKNLYLKPSLNCSGYKNCFSAPVSEEMPYVRASPVNMASLQHTRTCKADPQQQAQDTAASLPGDGRLAQLSPYSHKDISVNPEVLYRSGKKQDDYQELPNSSLTNATCPNPAHPENNVQGTQNFSLCQKGSTHHCLYT